MTEEVKVTLTVDGVIYGGWQAIEIERSVEQGATVFALAVTDKWAGQASRRPIRPGAACALAIDGEQVITGYVDEVVTDYDQETHQMTVTGRDKIGDLVDCAAAVDGGHEFANLTLTEIAGRICGPFGITVKAEVPVGELFFRFAIQPGETAWEAIERACRCRAVLPNGDGQGGLILTRAGKSGRAAGALELGKNILSATGSFSFAERFSLTVVRGQDEGFEGADPILMTAPEGRAKDPNVSRYRPQVILAEFAGDGVTFADRAVWQMRVARGRSRQATYTVQGWRDGGGALWRPNTLVRVRDSYLDIDADLLVAGVTLRIGEDGTTAELQVTLPDAFDLLPEPELDEDDLGLWGAP